MQQKYWYFGIRKKNSIVDAAGQARNAWVTLWAPTVYSTAAEAGQAAGKAMATRPGVQFFVQGFEKRLCIQKDGTCTGFEAEPAGAQ